jgi:hypothetical protein
MRPENCCLGIHSGECIKNKGENIIPYRGNEGSAHQSIKKCVKKSKVRNEIVVWWVYETRETLPGDGIGGSEPLARNSK